MLPQNELKTEMFGLHEAADRLQKLRITIQTIPDLKIRNMIDIFFNAAQTFVLEEFLGTNAAKLYPTQGVVVTTGDKGESVHFSSLAPTNAKQMQDGKVYWSEFGVWWQIKPNETIGILYTSFRNQIALVMGEKPTGI